MIAYGCEGEVEDYAAMERLARRPACVVADGGCEAPANLDVRPPRLPTCYRCGEAVCHQCSRRRLDRHLGRRTRRCLNCIEEEGGQP